MTKHTQIYMLTAGQMAQYKDLQKQIGAPKDELRRLMVIDNDINPGRALLNPYTIVYDRAQPNTLRITVVFLRNTWLSITIVILRVVCGRS